MFGLMPYQLRDQNENIECTSFIFAHNRIQSTVRKINFKSGIILLCTSLTLNIYSYFATEWCMRREQQVRYVEVGEHLRLTGIYSFQKMSTQIFSVKQ